MKKLILLSILLIVGCGNSLLYLGKPFAQVKIQKITKSNCEDECKIYEYDNNFIKLIDDYEHPWCICMTKCMAFDMFMASYNDTTDSFTFIDSSYCAPTVLRTVINPIDSLKQKINNK